MSNRIQIIQGGQYGSESKGAIAAHFCAKGDVDFAVRTGATNAGHTVVYEGERYAMQQLPVGWINPNVRLVLGAAALIDPYILDREIKMINDVIGEDVRSRLFIDHRAYIHRRVHAERSAESGRHHGIGATGKGCSEALVDRIRLRGQQDWTVGRSSMEVFRGLEVCDTEYLLNRSFNAGANIQLEGTQGQLLDISFGPYPFTTHKHTGPAQWMVEAGLSPGLPTDIVMVVRTFPIRVAGNSGPLRNEITWPMLAREINEKIGGEPLISPAAIAEFESAVAQAALRFDMPQTDPTGLSQHTWTRQERSEYRAAISEINAMALKSVPDTTKAELSKLFEMTTVTNKLRRIARLSDTDLTRSAAQIRPDQVVVTFLNYIFPDKWYSRHPVTPNEREWLINNVEHNCGATVTLINRGPNPEHIIEVDP